MRLKGISKQALGRIARSVKGQEEGREMKTYKIVLDGNASVYSFGAIADSVGGNYRNVVNQYDGINNIGFIDFEIDDDADVEYFESLLDEDEDVVEYSDVTPVQALGRIARSVKGQEEDKVFEPEGHPWDMADKLREVLGDEQFINELLKAMSHEEAVENLQFIAQNWDISLSDREEY